MPSLTFNVDHSRTLDKAVRLISVHTGPLIVTAKADPVVMNDDASHVFDPPLGGLTLYSPNGAIVNVTYWDEETPPQETVRGDADGQTGSFESRTVPELAKLAKDRGVDVEGTGKNGAKTKADYIKALRA